jgi:HNH endonuclease
MTETPLTAERLREVLDYNPETGIFMWNLTKKIAGHTQADGYVRIRLGKKQHYAHRLAWLYINSNLPTSPLDHINGIKSDNKISNLREVTPSQNMQNLFQARKKNKSGLLGVVFAKGKFQARIVSNGRQICLGTFSNAELAHATYLKAKAELHPFSTLGASEITS